MNAGKLVPDELVLALVGERLAAADCANAAPRRFPRTLAQAIPSKRWGCGSITPSWSKFRDQ
jgi:adenylate kinase family enzyme